MTLRPLLVELLGVVLLLGAAWPNARLLMLVLGLYLIYVARSMS